MKYPNAGDLQREMSTQLAGNPVENPWEVRSDIGLEGVFAERDDAEFYANEIRGSGARGVAVKRRMRAPIQLADMELRGTPVAEQNPLQPPRQKRFREGDRVVFRPTPASHALYSSAPPIGTVGSVVTVPVGRRRVVHLPGPGGGLTYVDWNGFGVQGVSPMDLVLEAHDRAYHEAESRRGHGNPEETFDTDILGGMEKAIWVTSYADWVEGLSKDQRKEAGTPVNLSGIEWTDVAPPSPASALLAAEDLYLAYERANGKTPGELFLIAVAADGERATDELADTFGHYLTMMAMGHGVSWFDDHEEFPLKQPSFEAHYGDGDVWWSPQLKSRHNPGSGSKLWRVWITGYPDSYVDVNAKNADEAMRMGALSQRASHHGEIVEIHVRPVGEFAGAGHSQHVRLGHGGRLEIVR